MNPEISIVVPVYKGVRFLREALGSVIAQTFADWECLCVDDGSKDGSGVLLDEIAADEPRIRVFHRPNGGTSVARNFALSQARGRYIAFLDEDDVYHPRMLETLHIAAERAQADIVGCEFQKFDESGHPVWEQDPPDECAWRIADRAKLADWVSRYYDGIPFEVWRNLYRRETAVGHEFPPGVRVEQDLYWHYTLFPCVSRYVRIPWCGYAWRANLSNGGFLHPDPESLISLVQTDFTVFKAVVGGLDLTEEQRDRLAAAMSEFLFHCLWRPLHNGIRMDSGQVARLRDGLRVLQGQGVSLDGLLPFAKRIRWKLALRTGNLRWMRTHKSAGREA